MSNKMYAYYKCVLISMFAVFVVAFCLALIYGNYRSSHYESAKKMIENGEYESARKQFLQLGEYEDSIAYLTLLSAIDLIGDGEYNEAITALESLGNIEDAQNWLFEAKYKYAQQLYDDKNYLESITYFEELLDDMNVETKSSLEKGLKDSKFEYAQQLYNEKNFHDAIGVLSELDSDIRTIDLLNRSKFEYGQQLYSQGEYLSAISFFNELIDDKDAQDWSNKSKYALALELKEEGNYLDALDYFLDLENYERSAQYAEEILVSSVEIDIEILYKAACRHFDTGLYWRALAEFQSLNGYGDSEKYVRDSQKMLRQSLSTTISVGQSYTVAINSNGTALTTGFDPTGRSNISNDNWKNLVSISAFSNVTAGLKLDGSVITTSSALNSEIGKNDSPWQDADIVAISVGNSYIVGLDSDGTLKSAGHDEGDGQRDVDDWTDIVAIATGWRHTVGLNATGDVFITGYGSTRQFNQMQANKEQWSDIVAIAAGGGDDVGNGHTVGLRKDGKVVAVGDNSFNQCEVENWENIVAIAAGDWFTIGLDGDGKIFITKPSTEKIQEYSLYTDVLNAENWVTTGLVTISACGGSAVGLYDDGNVIASGYSRHTQRDTANDWHDVMVYE